MSGEQRWMINDVLGFLMKMSRPLCLGPVRFVKIRNRTFIYISRTLLFFSFIMSSILQVYQCYILFDYSVVYSTKGRRNETFLGTFNLCAITVFNSYAVLYSESRIKKYMTCFTKLEKAIKVLQSTEKLYIKKWHLLSMFIILAGGINSIVAYDSYVYSNGALGAMIYVMMVEYVLSVILQQQFLYFALYVSFLLKVIKEQLQEVLSEIINNRNKNPLGNSTTARFQIPLTSINRAIDMIGMADQLFPDVINTKAEYSANQNIEQKIRQINESYFLTCEVMQELSSSEGFLLFVLLIYCSISVVYCTYVLIKMVNEGGSLLSIQLLIQSLEILIMIVRVIIIVEPCHLTYKRISKIRFLVSEIMCYVTSKSHPLYKVIDGFFHHLILNDVSYTTLGICKIGRPLVTSILGVVTTVLITIFEF